MHSYEALRKLHPCLSESRAQTGRIHLPVCPFCNLACRYCHRSLDAEKNRPGVSRGILPTERVEEVLGRALHLCPEITTVGIAGPGDTLATPHALEAFRIVDRIRPELIKCMSTNGLLLEERAEEIAKAHVDTVTVTVNAVDPAVEARINDGIYYHGEWIMGRQGAAILIRNQMRGIHKAVRLGITVKVNLVLIPGVNDRHVGETARAAAKAGASICNIIPLIPQERMEEYPVPSCEELEKARKEAGMVLDVFEHCQHCRADAVGRLEGEDFGRQVYGDLKPEREHFSHG